MKIIVAGAGSVGSHLAKMLSTERHEITVIDADESRLKRISSEADIITCQGSPSSISTQIKAGVKNADLFIAVSPEQDQDINIVAAMIAKKLGAGKVTARINNEEYQKAENKILFKELGIDSLFYPEKIAADEIIKLLRQNMMSDFMDYAHGKLQLIVFKVTEGTPLVDMKTETLRKQSGTLFRTVAITRSGKTIIPLPSTTFKVNDQVHIIARKEGFEAAVSFSGKDRLAINNIMILGGGRIGKMVAEKLENSVECIKLIDKNPERCEHLSCELKKTLVINGDGRNSDLLLDEGIKDVNAFVAVSDSSETNILSCVVAKRMGVDKVIAEVENFEYMELAESMGVDSVINKKLITAGRIFRFTTSSKVRSIKVLNGTNAEVLEYIVNPSSLITTGKLRELNFPEEAIIGGVIRGNETFMANGDTEIHPYDQVVVFSYPEASETVNKFFI
ncbi:MAG: Trk system potassium transporter TrkA [Alistipes sp.]|nr:Trk system potassium transporter TrkA [Candidatus Minthomonas equi]